VINFDYGFSSQSIDFLKLDRVSIVKDVGVLVDSELNFSAHIHEKIAAAFKMLGIIRRSLLILIKRHLCFCIKV